MLNGERLHFLSRLPQPLLTAYLNTTSAEASHHTPVPSYLTQLKKEAKAIAGHVPSTERDIFREQLHRVEEFLRDRVPHERGLAIFAGPATWELAPLQSAVENELRWGRPALTQLLWLLAEHKPCAIVVVDRAGARFFRYWLGEMAELQATKFDVDISQWKKKDLGHVAQPGIQKTYGSQRDVFEHRMDAQYERLCGETAQQVVGFCEREGLAAIFLVGSDRLIKPIEAHLPRDYGPRVALVEEDLGKCAPHELKQRLEPEIEKWEREHESALVNNLLDSDRGAVVGIDETLAQLQTGKLRTLLLARNLDADLRQCLNCGWADRSADPVCSVCRGERRSITLRDALPELARSYETDVKVVARDAAKKLGDAGGIGAWLRQPKHGELSRAASPAK